LAHTADFSRIVLGPGADPEVVSRIAEHADVIVVPETA
jgi:hypothetical protein